jgi:hypothetical protein
MVSYKMSGDVIDEMCPAYMWVKIIGITVSWSYCVLKFLVITIYILHVPGLIPHGDRETLYAQHQQRCTFCSEVDGCSDGIQAGLTEQFVFKACCISKRWLENWYPHRSPSSHLKLQLCSSFLQLYTQYTMSVHCSVSDTKGLDINSFATL